MVSDLVPDVLRIKVDDIVQSPSTHCINLVEVVGFPLEKRETSKTGLNDKVNCHQEQDSVLSDMKKRVLQSTCPGYAQYSYQKH